MSIENPDHAGPTSLGLTGPALARAWWIAEQVSQGASREWAERAWEDMGGSERSEERVDYELVAAEVLASTRPDGTDVETETITHWGCRLPGGIIRWDPGCVPYTEAEARADAQRNPGSVLVTRTETTTVATTPWHVVDEPADSEPVQ